MEEIWEISEFSRKRTERLFGSIRPCHLYDMLLDVVIPEEELKDNGFLFFADEHSKRAEYKKDRWSSMDFMPDNDNTRKCLRCSRLFNRLHSSSSSSSFPIRCQFHPQKTQLRNGFSVFPCCGTLAGLSRGCVTRGFHVHKQPSESVLTQFVAAPKPVSESDYRSRKIFALDVEMIHTINGLEAARVSLINHQGTVIVDEYVKPEGRIVHLNTEFSGIQMKHLEGARTLEQVRSELFLYVNRSSLLIGHGLSNDLKALRMVHSKVIDTAILMPAADGRMCSLRSLAWEFLGESIQEHPGGHCSVEDSTTCLALLEQFLRWRGIEGAE